MKKFKVGDHVRLLQYDKDGINGYGRVSMVGKKGTNFAGFYFIENMNMPYSGTVSKWVWHTHLAHR